MRKYYHKKAREEKTVTQIINILTACGCNPAAAIDKNGDAIIKVNAPKI